MLEQFIEVLNQDLAREYGHFHYYIFSSSVVSGLHREEMSEFFQKEAAGEMAHILEFSKMIRSLGGKPTRQISPYGTDLKQFYPEELLEVALKMEQEVVANYVKRQDEATELEEKDPANKVHYRYITVFLDEQILDSRNAVNEITEMLKK